MVQSNRGRHFDLAVRNLAPIIAELRSAGIRDVRQLAEHLNARGLSAPSGHLFSYGTMHRILVRLEKLRLGDGPQSRSCNRRSPKPWVRRPRRHSIRRAIQRQTELVEKGQLLKEDQVFKMPAD
jgi:hypothetical protein